jgi:WD40 repeat protein
MCFSEWKLMGNKFLVSMLLLMLVLPLQSIATNAQDLEIITAQNTDQLVRVSELGHGTITASAWSEDGQMVAIGMSQEIRVYRTDQSEPIIISGQRMVHTLTVRQDNQVLASSDSSGLVRLWNTLTGEELGVWGRENVGTASDLYFIPGTEILAINFFDLQELVSGTTLGTGIRFWEFETPHDPVTIPTSSYRGESNMTINNDNSLVATTMRDSQQGSGSPIATIIIRDRSSGEIVHQMTEVRPVFKQLVFSPTNPDLLVSIDVRGVVRFWNVEQGVELFALTLPYDHVTTATFSGDGSMLATGGIDNKVRLWRVADGALLEVLDDQPWHIQHLRMTATGDIYGFSDPALIAEVWNARTGAAITSFGIIENVTPSLLDMGFEPDGERLVGIGEDATIRMWQIATGKETVAMRVNPDDWDSVSVSDNGTNIVWMDAETGGVWVLEVWEYITPFSYQFEPVTRIDEIGFSPDAAHLLIGSYGDGHPFDPYASEQGVGGQFRMWDIPGGQPDNGILLLEDSVYAFAYSPAQPIIVYSSRGRLWQRDLREETEVALTDEDGWYSTALEFSPDGSILAAVNSRSIILYDTQNWTVSREISTQTYSVTGSHIAFHPDGSLIAFASGTMLKVFEIESGTLLTTIDAHVDEITRVVFNPTGSLIATSSLDGTVHLWGIE